MFNLQFRQLGITGSHLNLLATYLFRRSHVVLLNQASSYSKYLDKLIVLFVKYLF